MSILNLAESDIQIVLVSGFFDQLDDPNISDLFIKLLLLKKQGYQSKHSSRFLPVATNDFFGMHLILCEKKSMTPILCSKIISYSDCAYYNTPFPLLGLADFLKPEQQSEVEKIISQRVREGKDVSYSGGLTINPNFKGFGLSALLKDMYAGIHYLIHLNNNLRTMMGFGIVKVGTDVFFKTWGVYPLKVNGIEMSPTALPFTNGAESLLMWADLENLSPYKIEMGKRFEKIWNERIEFTLEKRKIAA
jgi:hypothetical protein